MELSAIGKPLIAHHPLFAGVTKINGSERGQPEPKDSRVGCAGCGCAVMLLGAFVLLLGAVNTLAEHPERLPNGSEHTVGEPAYIILPLLLGGTLLFLVGIFLFAKTFSDKP